MAEKNEPVQGHRTPYSAMSYGNATNYLMERFTDQMATAVPCTVQAVYKGSTTGYVDVLPLVGTIDGKKQYVPPVTLYHLPYCRIQGGMAALIIDPVVGDKGIAVFMSSDTSGVEAGTSEPQQPASYRKFSQSDGYYIGGFLNQQPSTFVEVDPSGSVTITAPAGVTINGTVTVTGDVVAGGISLMHHTHPGDSGGTTGAPN